MKNKITTAAVITFAALSHAAPAFGIAMIATGSETIQAFGTVVLFVSTLALGYLHGLNRTHESF